MELQRTRGTNLAVSAPSKLPPPTLLLLLLRDAHELISSLYGHEFEDGPAQVANVHQEEEVTISRVKGASLGHDCEEDHQDKGSQHPNHTLADGLSWLGQ